MRKCEHLVVSKLFLIFALDFLIICREQQSISHRPPYTLVSEKQGTTCGMKRGKQGKA